MPETRRMKSRMREKVLERRGGEREQAENSQEKIHLKWKIFQLFSIYIISTPTAEYYITRQSQMKISSFNQTVTWSIL